MDTQQLNLHHTASRLRRNIRRRSHYAEREPKGAPSDVALHCPHCGEWHYPDEKGFIVCPVYKKEQSEHTQVVSDYETKAFYDTLRTRIGNLNSS